LAAVTLPAVTLPYEYYANDTARIYTAFMLLDFRCADGLNVTL